MPHSGVANQVDLPKKSYWGRLVGVVLGFAFGGPHGAVIGFLLGLLHDNQSANTATTWNEARQNTDAYFPRNEQAAFMMGVAVLSAKMAKADGRVSRAEIDAFKRAFRIAPYQEDAIGRVFDSARNSVDGFQPYAFQLARIFHDRPAILEEILTGLFIIAAADNGRIGFRENAYLKSVAFIFGFGAQDFARIAARAGFGAGPDNDAAAKEHAPSKTAEAFSILGVAETATPAEIKSAYRSLIRAHHPDRLIAQGMPPEFVATATEKMKRINVAYDTVCKIKGVK